MNPKNLFIVNTVDRPDARHIAELQSDGKLHYLHPELRPWPPMPPERATPLRDFGFTFSTLSNGKIWCVLTHETTAKYPDGARREWQGEPVFALEPDFTLQND